MSSSTSRPSTLGRTAILLAGLAAFPVSAASSTLPDLASTPSRSGQKASNDAAVVIGIEDYVKVPDVPHAARDAESFRSFLLYTRGVPSSRITTLVSAEASYHAGREAILGAVAKAGKDAHRGGTVWVFFSGHGVADPDHPERRLLLGDDVQGELSSFLGRGVSLDEIRAAATSGGADVVLILDACYSGAGRGGGSITAGTHFVVPSDYQAAPAGIEWEAAGPNELSGPFEAASQGAFSYFATGALRGWADGELDGRADGRVTAAEGQAYVTRMLGVAGVRTQTPVLLGSAEKVLSEGTLEAGPSAEQVAAAARTPAPASGARPQRITPTTSIEEPRPKKKDKKGEPCWLQAPCAPFDGEGRLSAVGRGTSLGSADAAARDALMQPFRERVDATARALGGANGTEDEVREVLRLLDEGIAIAARHQDGATSDSLAVLDANASADRLRARIAGVESSLSPVQGDSSAAPVQTAARELHALERTALARSALTVIEGRPAPSVSRSEADARYREALGHFVVQLPGGALSAPLAAKLGAMGVGVTEGQKADMTLLIRLDIKRHLVSGFHDTTLEATVRLFIGQDLVRTLTESASASSSSAEKADADAQRDLNARLVDAIANAVIEVLQ